MQIAAYCGNNIRDGGSALSWFGQAGVLDLGLVFALALVLLVFGVVLLLHFRPSLRQSAAPRSVHRCGFAISFHDPAEQGSVWIAERVGEVRATYNYELKTELDAMVLLGFRESQRESNLVFVSWCQRCIDWNVNCHIPDVDPASIQPQLMTRVVLESESDREVSGYFVRTAWDMRARPLSRIQPLLIEPLDGVVGRSGRVSASVSSVGRDFVRFDLLIERSKRASGYGNTDTSDQQDSDVDPEVLSPPLRFFLGALLFCGGCLIAYQGEFGRYYAQLIGTLLIWVGLVALFWSRLGAGLLR